MKENDFNFKKYNKDSNKKINSFKIKNNIDGLYKNQNDNNNNKNNENLNKSQKFIYKRETEEEMNNKYNLLMAKYQKEKKNQKKIYIFKTN